MGQNIVTEGRPHTRQTSCTLFIFFGVILPPPRFRGGFVGLHRGRHCHHGLPPREGVANSIVRQSGLFTESRIYLFSILSLYEMRVPAATLPEPLFRVMFPADYALARPWPARPRGPKDRRGPAGPKIKSRPTESTPIPSPAAPPASAFSRPACRTRGWNASSPCSRSQTAFPRFRDCSGRPRSAPKFPARAE